MARGIPVVAAAAGGHLETVGGADGCLFDPGDVEAAATRLTALSDPIRRSQAGSSLRIRQRQEFSLTRHVQRLGELYAEATLSRSARPALPERQDEK
jgi:glycosyltransferase involved in cell wall biosynthesis